MKLLSLFFVFLFAQTTFANEQLTCILGSGGETTSYTFEFDYDATEEFFLEDYSDRNINLDLSFGISLDCDGQKNCFLNLVIDSQIVEDEVGSLGVEFEMTDGNAIVLEEELTDAPDKKDYTLVCDFVTNTNLIK